MKEAIDLSQVEEDALVEEIIRRLSLLDPNDIIHYRTDDVYQFAKKIVDGISEEIRMLDILTSEFTKQKEDLEHKLCFGMINGTISDTEKEQLTEQITDAIVLRRYTKDNRGLICGFRDTFSRICGSIQKYNNLSYNGKSALYGEDTDGIVIRSDLNLNEQYQERLSGLFRNSSERVRTQLKDEGAESAKIARVNDISPLRTFADTVSQVISK